MTPELKYARDLVKEALDRMDREENMPAAAWRLADALGWIARLHPGVMGISKPTGRGNKLDTTNLPPKHHDSRTTSGD